jgi:hypothetical protein
MRILLTIFLAVCGLFAQAQWLSPYEEYAHTVWIHNGNLVVQDGSEGLGKVLMDADGDGLAEWTDLPAIGVDTIYEEGDEWFIVICADEVCDTSALPAVNLAVANQRLTGNRVVNLMGYSYTDTIDEDWVVRRSPNLTGSGEGGFVVAYNDGTYRMELGAGENSISGLPRIIQRIIDGPDTLLFSIDIEQRKLSLGVDGITELTGFIATDSTVSGLSRNRAGTEESGVVIGKQLGFSGSDTITTSKHALLFSRAESGQTAVEAFPDSLLLHSSDEFYKIYPRPPLEEVSDEYLAIDSKGRLYRRNITGEGLWQVGSDEGVFWTFVPDNYVGVGLDIPEFPLHVRMNSSAGLATFENELGSGRFAIGADGGLTIQNTKPRIDLKENGAGFSYLFFFHDGSESSYLKSVDTMLEVSGSQTLKLTAPSRRYILNDPPPVSESQWPYLARDPQNGVIKQIYEDAILPIQDTVPTGSELDPSQIIISINQAVDSLLFTVKYSNGTVKVAAMLLQ